MSLCAKHLELCLAHREHNYYISYINSKKHLKAALFWSTVLNETYVIIVFCVILRTNVSLGV